MSIRAFYKIYAVAISFLVLFASTPWAMAQRAYGPVPASLWGMHVNGPSVANDGPYPYPPSYITFKTLRLHDGGVTWPEIQASRGSFDWSRMDLYVALAQQQGLDLDYDIFITPTWASSNPTLLGNGIPGGASPPASIQDYTNFVTALATRYKGKIKYYEGWNEANQGWNGNSDPNFVPVSNESWVGTPAQLAQLQKINYQVIKSIDPNALIISPAFVSDTGFTAFTAFLNAGGTNTFDICGYHYYVNPAPPETIGPLANQLRQVLNSFGLSTVPLYNTETGWSLPNPFPSNSAPGYVARSYLISWAAGIQKFCWYAWNNRNFVTLCLNGPQDSNQVNPAGLAYRRIQDWMIGRTMLTCSSNANVWVSQLQDSSANQYTIVWTGDDSNQQYTLQGNASTLQAIDINGTNVAIQSNGLVAIGPNPILVSKIPNAAKQHNTEVPAILNKQHNTEVVPNKQHNIEVVPNKQHNIEISPNKQHNTEG